MKLHLYDVRPTDTAGHRKIRAHHEHNWIHNHPALVALILACMISALLVVLLSSVMLYITMGVWPLFG